MSQSQRASINKPARRRSLLSRLSARFFRSPTAHRVTAWALARYLSFVFRTTRWTYDGIAEGLDVLQPGRHFHIVLWHNRVAIMPFGWRWDDHQLTALISDHRDGRLLTSILDAAGVGHICVPANAMGTRSQAEDVKVKLNAAREVRAAMRAGSQIGVVGDGPTGPRFKLKPAVLALARATNAEITLVTYAVKRRRIAGSWDRLIIPYPFNRGVLRWSKKFYNPRLCEDEAALESLREEIERDLIALTDGADRMMGHDPIT